jgi:hypothetical protein
MMMVGQQRSIALASGLAANLAASVIDLDGARLAVP